MDASTPPGAGTELAHNSIGFWRSFAQPVAMQAPVGGAAILTATMATITGGAGPLSFLLGIVCGVFLVLIFAELARHFASAGAVYAYAGLMAGVSFAFVIGWIYVLMMTAFWAGTLSATAVFFNATLSTASAGAHVPWVLISLVTWVIVAYLVSRKIAISTAILFVLEVIGAALIVSVGIVVFAKGGHGGSHFGFSYYFTFEGMSVNSAFLGVVIAFLGFGGFEGAAVFGEETRRPRRYLPRTMLASLLFSGVIYTYASWFENVGFKNSAALAASPSPLVQVTQMYVDKPIAVILGFAAVVSAFSAAVGSANAATRYLYALGRDGFLSRRLAKTEHTQRSPIAALVVLAIPALLLSIGFAGTGPANAFNYIGGTGGFLYTFIYLCISTACIWYFNRHRQYGYSLLAVISGAATGYALWNSIVPAPAYPYDILHYIAVGVVLLGVIIVASSNSLRNRLRNGPTFRIAAGTAEAGPAGAAAGQAD
ncbi:MAG TPA: APC family permease [Streptosporangiaceae bacterium]|nr:APC family permease [Streptosporangiaceae bacterium]